MGRLGALDWQILQIGFGAGLFTKTDNRFSSPPSLDIARDVQFEELGGVQVRLPFGSVMGNGAIVGGGSLGNCRRHAVINGELCVFTDTGLYSWNAQQSAFVLRGTHLAITVDETPRLATAGDQIDGDRAELSGTIVIAWTEGTQVYAGAIDKTTGSVMVSTTAVSTAIGRPRLVALATKILLFVEASATLITVRAIDPASPSGGITGAGTTVLNTNYNLYYDVVRAGTQDLVVGACRRQVTTSYEVFTVTPALVVTTSTKARVCDGPIAVATISDGTQTQVIRGNGTNVQGDLLTTSTLADVFTGQALGTVSSTPINQIAAEFVATTCTAFWSSDERTDASGNFFLKQNTVTTANSIGTQSTMAIGLGVASRAFAHGGSVFVWVAFASDSTTFGSGSPIGVRAQLQNTYFLYRSDGLVVAKSVWQTAGGFSASTGHLPGVTAANSNDYVWLGSRRRRIDLGDDGDHTGLEARSPIDIAYSFDMTAARRGAQLGRTLYVSSGIVAQYDGAQLSELGFLVYPWAFAVADNGAGGNLSAGEYSWKGTMRWTNAQGEMERSTTATGEQLTLAASHSAVLTAAYLHVTNKRTSVPNIELWRTPVNAGDGASFFLVTSQNPTVLVADNPYVPNVITAGTASVVDNYSDVTLAGKEPNPENDGVLESLAPPGAKIIIPSDTRLFLAGVAGDPDRIWYSRERGDGEIASFHDSLTVEVPPTGGSITAIWIMDGVLYVGRQYAIYALPGVGFDNAGGGQNYGPAQIVSVDLGPVSQEAQCLTPLGTVFKSAKGWYLMDRGRGLRYIGAAVNLFDSDTVLSMQVMTSRHEVRVLTNARMLTWTYTDAVDLVDAPTPGGMGQWSERTISDGLDAVIYNGVYTYLTSTGPKQEQSSYSGLTYGLDVETSWIKLNGLQGYGKCGEIMVLGEYRSACLVRIRLARDYQEDGAGNPVYFDDRAWAPTPTVVGSALQVRHSPSASNGNCQALKVRITAVAEAVRATLATASMSPTVPTSGMAWAATWQAANTGTPGVSFPGEMGNRLTMSIGATTFTAPGSFATFPYTFPFAFVSDTGSVIVNDHFTWNASLGRWMEDQDNIGVLVAGTLTVADLEAAIGAGSRLTTLAAADATPSKTVNVASMLSGGLVPSGVFSGGTYTSPTGEALKLTGIALRVGLKPELYRRLPAGQKQ